MNTHSPFSDLHEAYQQDVGRFLRDDQLLSVDELAEGSNTALSVVSYKDIFLQGDSKQEKKFIKSLPEEYQILYLEQKEKGKKERKKPWDYRFEQYKAVLSIKEEYPDMEEKTAVELVYKRSKKQKYKKGFPLESFQKFYGAYKVYKTRRRESGM